MSDTMTAESLTSLRDHALESWKAMHAFAMGIIDSVPEEHWFARAGENTNHTMWIAGHLAFAYGTFTERMGEANDLPERYTELFNMGTEPLADPSVYPPVRKVRAELERMATRLMQIIEGLNAEALAEPMGEPFAESCPTRAHAAMILTFHDGIHAGQVASVRKSLGLAPTMA